MDIKEIINAHIPGIIDHWDLYETFFKEERLPAKTRLLAEGDLAKKMIFITEGCLRLHYTDLNKDVTTQFFFENSFVCSLESFLDNQPSRYNIETLEKGCYYLLGKEHFQILLDTLPGYREHFNLFVQKRMFHYLNSLLDYIRYSPEQRYHALVRDHPEILQRIPHYYIASYLGITPISFSRIRGRR
jgi:CRP-like cAMP-binding protein